MAETPKSVKMDVTVNYSFNNEASQGSTQDFCSVNDGETFAHVYHHKPVLWRIWIAQCCLCGYIDGADLERQIQERIKAASFKSRFKYILRRILPELFLAAATIGLGLVLYFTNWLDV